MEFAIIGNNYQVEKAIHTKNLLHILFSKGATVKMCRSFYEFIKPSLGEMNKAPILFEDNNFSADMVISIGGDGTFLKAARKVGNKEIPIIGINTGRLGFLADVSPENMEQTIEEILQGKYEIEKRCVLQLGCNHPKIKSPFALNEIAILKRDDASMITIHTHIDNSYLATYQSDGLIIATPTGSTAYSLSVGGPIVEPNSKTLVINPVAPHSLNVRPFIIRDNITVHLKIESRNHNFLVSIDGRSYTCNDDTELCISKADYSVQVVKRQNHHFYDTLRDKLMWGADKR
ncbi:inorganic polyphosphate/ATP-NAD kinase [Bacteroides coprosuis DSM 18011]|uniref:NAD kinase n=1 Tax=Bacteroides coprosuis DSM 18011 TaxID=679937 RepID=F3ZPL3_9BACE|nr:MULTISPECIES: NAD kinase [Bacteroides]EGJ70372.1 inorganic polyphosphate/ATP-NAD kinase [Bacteroides coprosuis DSM 18011]